MSITEILRRPIAYVATAIVLSLPFAACSRGYTGECAEVADGLYTKFENLTEKLNDPKLTEAEKLKIKSELTNIVEHRDSELLYIGSDLRDRRQEKGARGCDPSAESWEFQKGSGDTYEAVRNKALWYWF